MPYKLLEPNVTPSLGSSLSFNTSDNPTLATPVVSLFTLSFVVIVLTASFVLGYAGVLRMPGTAKGIQESKDAIRRVTIGILFVFSLGAVFNMINRDFNRADVGLGALRARRVAIASGGGLSAVVPTAVNSQAGSGTSRACDDPSYVKSAILSGNVCANASCTVLSGCNYQQYLPFIKSKASFFGVDYKMIVVTMCKESSGNPEAHNQNPNGSYDCGIMQINQAGPCDVSSLRANVETNITKGIEIMKQKISATNETYPGFPNVNGIPVAGVFASYNCCSNGTIPNSPSVSCTSADGWPSIPKWACPTDPGSGPYNMCGVKAYACELTACLPLVP